MHKTPKTVQVFIIQGNYGGRWEDLVQESFYINARQRLQEYQENETGYSHRIIKRRVPYYEPDASEIDERNKLEKERDERLDKKWGVK